MTTAMRRYPLEPLVAMLNMADDKARRLLKVSGARWATCKVDGVGADAALRYAERAGFMPGEVWPSWYDDEFERLSKVCADESCDAVFIAENPRRIYCSNTCRDRRVKRRWIREKYATDEAFRESEKARVKAYHAEVQAARKRRSVPRETGEVRPAAHNSVVTSSSPLDTCATATDSPANTRGCSPSSPQAPAGRITA